LAENAEAVQEHADCGGFPVTTIREVAAVIDPATGEPA
jgi:hypothetical protein